MAELFVFASGSNDLSRPTVRLSQYAGELVLLLVRASGLFAQNALEHVYLTKSPVRFAKRTGVGSMDVLSEVLKVVKLQGALFYNGEFSAPWSVYAAPSRGLARYFATGSEEVIVYHLLTEGQASARLDSGERVALNAGDIVMIPHGDPHTLENGRPAKTMNGSESLEEVLSQGLKLWRFGGGGEVTKFVCGYMGYEPRLGQRFLSGLPSLFKINIRKSASGHWLEDSIRFSVEHANSSEPGRDAMLAKLSEVLFVETLRAYISELPADGIGWLAGARDPEVGRALALMHRNPGHAWTIASLANEAGTSRSVLAERFRHYLNETPMAYLTRWRLRLGAQMLTSTSHSVAQIAAEVGYESEAAFNRAFKREFELPPAKFRSQSKAAYPGQLNVPISSRHERPENRIAQPSGS